MKRRFKRKKKPYHRKRKGKPLPEKRRLSGKKEVKQQLFEKVG
jgi:hypothetical protein